MEVVQITDKNLEKCGDAFMAVYNSPPWNYQWKEQDVAEYLRGYTHDPNFIGFMVMEKGKVLGAILASKVIWWTGRQLIIDEMFISAKIGARSFETILMGELERYARNNGISMITVKTNKHKSCFKTFKESNFHEVDFYVFMFKELS